MLSHSDNNHNNHTYVVEAFNSYSRYLDYLLNIDNPCFKQMVSQIYPAELQLNKTNLSESEASFWSCSYTIAIKLRIHHLITPLKF